MPTEMRIPANTSPSGLARTSVAPKAVEVSGIPQARVDAPAVDSAAGQPVSRAELDAALSQLSNYVQNVQRNLNFSIDDSSGQVVVKVIDSESEEVIRQIPSEEMLAMARRLRELSGEQVSGLLVQSQA